MTRNRILAVGGGAMALFALGWLSGHTMDAQPHMHNALNLLHRAGAELTAAKPNKGGHRVEAIRLVNEAIRETEDGIADGNRG